MSDTRNVATSSEQTKRRVVVDLDALAQNYRQISALVEPAACAAVVKADAYGLGANEVAQALSGAGCTWFFVATPQEAVDLRSVLPSAGIVVLESPVDGEWDELLRHNIVPTLNCYDDATRLCAVVDSSSAARCVIHIDSGMNRLGMSERDVSNLVGDAPTLSRLRIEYVMTHLACADDPDDSRNDLQLERFNRLRESLPVHRTSIASSSGAFLNGDFNGDLARVGVALYGGAPQPGAENPMREVVNIQGQILQIRELDEQDAVGYGAIATVPAGSRLATVGFGYADGYPRAAGDKSHAVINGARVPVVGRISMDNLVVDITEVSSDVGVGDWVSLVGSGISLDEVADAAGTISYELLVRLGPRVVRIYSRPE